MLKKVCQSRVCNSGVIPQNKHGVEKIVSKSAFTCPDCKHVLLTIVGRTRLAKPESGHKTRVQDFSI